MSAAAASLPPQLEALYIRLGAWRRCADRVYAVCQNQLLEWPSHTVEWLPDRKQANFPDFALHYTAVGSQALRGSSNYISIVETALPLDIDGLSDYLRGEDGVSDGVDGADAHYADVKGHTRLDQMIVVDDPVLNIKAMPQDTEVIAARLASCNIPLFHLARRDKFSKDPAMQAPDIVLKGAKEPGWALSWSPCSHGVVAAGCDDGLILMWDINDAMAAQDEREEQFASEENDEVFVPQATEVLPINIYKGHNQPVNRVSFHYTQMHLFTSACDDGSFNLWDRRAGGIIASKVQTAHVGPCFAAEMHPTAAFQCATGGSDGVVRLWDIRRMQHAVVELAYHTNQVTNVRWAPFHDAVLMSSGADQKVCLWDLTRGDNLVETKDGGDNYCPPELAFMHGGHLSAVTDAAWCPSLDDEWTIASTDALNGLMLWRPLQSVVQDHIDIDEFDADMDDDDDD